MRQRLLSWIGKKRARVPSVFEIVWSRQRPKRRVLNADDSFRRRQNGVWLADRGTQDNVAPLLSVGQIDFEAWEGGASQSVVGDAGPHDLPERTAVSFRNGCLCGKRESDATYGGYS